MLLHFRALAHSGVAGVFCGTMMPLCATIFLLPAQPRSSTRLSILLKDLRFPSCFNMVFSFNIVHQFLSCNWLKTDSTFIQFILVC